MKNFKYIVWTTTQQGSSTGSRFNNLKEAKEYYKTFILGYCPLCKKVVRRRDCTHGERLIEKRIEFIILSETFNENNSIRFIKELEEKICQ